MNLPVIVNDLSIFHLGAACCLFVVGYAIHELFHIIPLAVAGVDYSVTFSPGSKPLWYNLTVGRVFEFETYAPRVVNVISLLAPGILALPGFFFWAYLLAQPQVRLGTLVLTATWIVVFLPSLADWKGVLEQFSSD